VRLTTAGSSARHVPENTAAAVLHVENLQVRFRVPGGVVHAVDHVSFDLRHGETLGLVGESGSGKTMTSLALLRLLESPPAEIPAGSVIFEGRDLLRLPEREMADLRGSRLSMVFQEPMTSLNPIMTIGRQIDEPLMRHLRLSARAARARTRELLGFVGIPRPDQAAASYPHQFSGGMRQRAMIAIALACRPSVLIADEPTTALDVTIQAQILELMAELQDRSFMAIQLISHNLGVVSEIADDIIVMYAGRIVERATASELFANPRHPYTIGLIETLPSIEHRVARLPVIKGSVPDPARMIAPGCRFAARCPRVIPACREAEPPLVALAPGHLAACIRAAA